jgi:putative iron-dependent peroxidase
LKQDMKVARETPTFIFGASLDMTGFIDGTSNPENERQPEVAIVPNGEAGAGGSFVTSQRWVHDLEVWN